ncbi:Transmembrane protein 33 [Nymphon striatum]|nr:Transmembrane protein 33 [Nymphon striatum]
MADNISFTEHLIEKVKEYPWLYDTARKEFKDTIPSMKCCKIPPVVMLSFPIMNEEQENEANSQNSNEANSQNANEQSSASSQQGSFQAVFKYMIERRIDSLLWLTRISSMLFTIGYFFPFFGNPYSSYQKALISNAATSALRLHQRVPHLQFSRQFLTSLFMEDSLALLPIALFAFLHSTYFSAALAEKFGCQNSFMMIKLRNFVTNQQVNIFRMIAMSEITLMPVCVIMIFSGQISLMTPFIFYRFLIMRYSSQRNPYTRNTFAELRFVTEHAILNPRCPQFIGNLCRTVISFIIRLAPPTAPQH